MACYCQSIRSSFWRIKFKNTIKNPCTQNMKKIKLSIFHKGNQADNTSIVQKLTMCLQNDICTPSGIFSVIIVGAGMAGLGAAKTLQEAGIHNFLILEGQESAGGRVCSVLLDRLSNKYIELGAQWIHGENNPVFNLAAREQLISNITSDEGQGLYLKPNGVEIPFSMVQEVAGVVGDVLEDCCQFIDDSAAPNSIGEFLTVKFDEYLDSCNDPPHVRKDKQDLFDWHVRFQMIDNSCDQLSCLSAKSWGFYQFTGGTDYNNFKGGYSSLVDCLTRDLPEGSLKTQCEVDLISYNRNQSTARVLCGDGREYLANHVIVTSSLGFLKERHDSLFNPPLPPDIVEAIVSMGFDTINKLFLVYNSAWWPDDMQGIQLIWDSQETADPDHQSWLRHVSGFDVLANINGVLLGWVGGDGAVTMESLADEEISHHCTKVLRKFMRRPDIPLPDKILRSRWHSNKFVRGGYSHTTIQCDKQNCGPKTLGQPIYVSTPSSDGAKHPVILLAGEAVHQSCFSTTHGAYMSGTEQAQIIIDYLQQSNL